MISFVNTRGRIKRCTLQKLSRQETPNSVKRKKRKQWRVVIPRANHNTHRTTFVISSRTGCCRAAKSTRLTTDQNEHVCAVDIMQFTVVIPRTRTNMFVQYIACNHKMYKGTTFARQLIHPVEVQTIRPRSLRRATHISSTYTHRPVRDMSVIKGPDTTDQSIFGISELLTRISTHHTRTRTSLFNIYTSQTPPNHHTTTPPQRCKTRKNASSRAGCWQHHTTTTKTPPHHHITTHTTTSSQSCETPNSTSSRAGCLNMFVIMSVKGSWNHGPEHLCYQRVVDENYHTSHIFNIYPSASSWHVGYKGSWYHGPEHLWYQRVVDENYHTSHILHIYTSQQHISTHHWAKTFSGRKILDRRTPKGTQISTKTRHQFLGRMFPKGSWYHGLCRTSLFNIYTSQTAPNHHTTTKDHKGAKHRQMRVLGLDVDTTTPPPQKHNHITTSPPTPPHHHNLATSSRAGCLNMFVMFVIMSVKGRDTTDQNIFVISELLMRIITHHTSSTYTHWRVRDMSG